MCFLLFRFFSSRNSIIVAEKKKAKKKKKEIHLSPTRLASLQRLVLVVLVVAMKISFSYFSANERRIFCACCAVFSLVWPFDRERASEQAN